MLALSKSIIDKAGLALARNRYRDEVNFIELEEVFDEYRKSHLQPLTETTLKLQQLLSNYGSSYYIAQRLKRKPQIIRKLNRLSVRLTQLQDIGGCRIIVSRNSDVNKLYNYLLDTVNSQNVFTINRVVDYREKGRDDTGYRALHIILKHSGVFLELQIRSRIQHYWAESIERTSVIYGYHLKENEGDRKVISYFKSLSDVFYEIEAGRDVSIDKRLRIDGLRAVCEKIILQSDRHKIFDSFVDENIIHTLKEKEGGSSKSINNWILVFDWNRGAFVSWDIVSRDPSSAVRTYIENEKNFPIENGYEVVLVGSSDVATIRQTHSHYFGIETYANILENLDTSIVGFTRKIDIDVGARQILSTMRRRHFWGKKTILPETLRNHFCKDVLTFDSSLRSLLDRNLIQKSALGGISLNVREKMKIEQYL
ncbi:MAG: RelA/SpoT domain-containing protein [Alistipes senegalensis]|nr:RelA/SpoT domain-containing protein [Oxalobacter formigenes]MCM1281974.1 RelA/SpoT domain-containing protein [Alistipes senegalensis]